LSILDQGAPVQLAGGEMQWRNFAAVGDIKATKEVTFTVQQSSDGKISVAVDPFQF